MKKHECVINSLTDKYRKEWFDKNKGVSRKAAYKQYAIMHSFLTKWASPADLVCVIAEMDESALAKMIHDQEKIDPEIFDDMIDCVLGLYTLCEERMRVDTEKKLNEVSESQAGGDVQRRGAKGSRDS